MRKRSQIQGTPSGVPVPGLFKKSYFLGGDFTLPQPSSISKAPVEYSVRMPRVKENLHQRMYMKAAACGMLVAYTQMGQTVARME